MKALFNLLIKSRRFETIAHNYYSVAFAEELRKSVKENNNVVYTESIQHSKISFSNIVVLSPASITNNIFEASELKVI